MIALLVVHACSLGTDDVGPSRIPSHDPRFLTPSDTANAFMMTKRELEKEITDGQTTHSVYSAFKVDYLTGLNSYLSILGREPMASNNIKWANTTTREAIEKWIRLMVFYVDASNDPFIQTGFVIDQGAGNIIITTAPHGIEDAIDVYACEYHVFTTFIRYPNRLRNRSYIMKQCHNYQKVELNTGIDIDTGMSSMDDIVLFRKGNDKNEINILSSELTLNLETKMKHGGIVVCYGIVGPYNENSFTIDGYRIRRVDYESYLGNPFDIKFTFGMINNINILMNNTCSLNGFIWEKYNKDYLSRNPKTVEQLQFHINGYTNVTTQFGLPGGYCAPIQSPFQVIMLNTVGNYVTPGQSDAKFSFANQHALVAQSTVANVYVSKLLEVNVHDSE